MDFVVNGLIKFNKFIISILNIEITNLMMRIYIINLFKN